VGMSAAPSRTESEEGTVPAWMVHELVSSKDETIRAKEATLSALKEALSRQEEALLAKDAALQAKDVALIELKSELLIMRSRGQAILANRWIIELIATQHAEAESRREGVKPPQTSTAERCLRFAQQHLLVAEGTGLNEEARALSAQLAAEGFPAGSSEGDAEMRQMLENMCGGLSALIQFPALPAGVYAGGINGVTGAALGVWIARAQQLGIITFRVTLLDDRNLPMCVVSGGRITKTSATFFCQGSRTWF